MSNDQIEIKVSYQSGQRALNVIDVTSGVTMTTLARPGDSFVGVVGGPFAFVLQEANQPPLVRAPTPPAMIPPPPPADEIPE